MNRFVAITVTVLGGALGIAACMQSNNAMPVGNGDCYMCHQPDYEGTSITATPHSSLGFGTTCGDCHRTTDWVPAIEGNHVPEVVFPILAGPHAALKCLACHDPALGSSKAGVNTVCLDCHPDSATVVADHRGRSIRTTRRRMRTSLLDVISASIVTRRVSRRIIPRSIAGITRTATATTVTSARTAPSFLE